MRATAGCAVLCAGVPHLGGHDERALPRRAARAPQEQHGRARRVRLARERDARRGALAAGERRAQRGGPLARRLRDRVSARRGGGAEAPARGVARDDRGLRARPLPFARARVRRRAAHRVGCTSERLR